MDLYVCMFVGVYVLVEATDQHWLVPQLLSTCVFRQSLAEPGSSVATDWTPRFGGWVAAVAVKELRAECANWIRRSFQAKTTQGSVTSERPFDPCSKS